MKPPAFQFYADDFLAGVADMTQAEVGAYILLLSHQWSRGAVPSDPARAGLIAKGKVSPHVMAKFPNGQNQRLEHERQKQADYRQQQSNKGKASAKARFNRGSTVVQPEGQPKGNSPSPSPSPSPDRNTDGPAKPSRCVFVKPLPHEVQDYSTSIGYPMDGQAWCDSYEQKGWMVGKNKMKDWKAAVRNWKSNGWLPTEKPAARTTPDRINFKTDDYTNLET